MMGSCDGDGHPSDDGNCVSSHDGKSESSSSSDGGSDRDADDDYNDNESSSDADGEDSGRSKKRGRDCSPSVTSSHPPDSPSDDNVENPPRPYKQQKVAYDKKDMTPIRR
ncbi:hypothetical protein A9K55_003625 [Cordyceps militaris]|uniref:Uncharacterized protein n=1 Tax=Cordyceps militaris TaxID=73501 RepID=A0A2H4S7G9_CORMI|nr:hypothetical protein A9K55_003625 [Cordyceps militaris]